MKRDLLSGDIQHGVGGGGPIRFSNGNKIQGVSYEVSSCNAYACTKGSLQHSKQLVNSLSPPVKYLSPLE